MRPLRALYHLHRLRLARCHFQLRRYLGKQCFRLMPRHTPETGLTAPRN
jgi:hypothetical protein